MDYQKIYNELIESRKYRGHKKELGYEIHHIIPRCLGGSDDSYNLVKLTYREHFIAHSLLSRIYEKNNKIQYAFLCMLRDPQGKRLLTSRMVDTIKRRFSEFKKWHTKLINPGKTENSRKAAKKRMTERNPIVLNPAKNHTSKKVIVIFSDGSEKIFDIKKYFFEYLKERTNLGMSTLKYKCKDEKFLLSLDIVKITEHKLNPAKEISLGKKWYTDGNTNLYLSNKEEIPQGFLPGMKVKNKT